MSPASRPPNTADEGLTPSPDQWRVIRDSGRHLLVSAGAGTGKTRTIIWKVLYLLGVPVHGAVREPALRLDEIAAITFTNKAASELKANLRAALRGAGRMSDAYAVDTARVGTIHAFCGDILREFAMRAGLPPGLALLDEAESAARRSACVHEVLLGALEERAEAATVIPGMGELVAGHSVKDIETWVNALVDEGDHLGTLARRAHERHGHEHTLVQLAERAHAMLVARLRAAGVMDYDRMIEWTRDLLRDVPDVRRALQQRIRVLFVDEFQDVDPVQREIAYLLGEPESERTDTTRLVLVGDPKQSIYGFRGADVRVWSRVRRDFDERKLGHIETLGSNYRSVAGVLALVDHVIGGLLDEPTDPERGHRDFEVRYAALAPMRPSPDDAPAVELLVIPARENGKAHTAATVRRSEAGAVADRARELHEAGTPWKEMAVLLCGWGALGVYESALRAARIPTYALRATGFYDRLEVTDLLVALRAVRDPLDDRALAGFLRGPFVAVSDETLLRVARRSRVPYWPMLRHAAIPEAGEAARLHRGAALLERFTSLRDRVSAGALAARLAEESGYLAMLALRGGEAGGQALANVRKLLRRLDSMRDATLADALDALDGARAAKVVEGDARLYGERDDVVTITSVHGAKGLEWDVVFWCDLVRRRANDKPKLLVNEDDLALAPGDGEESERYAAACDRRADEEIAEDKRLWYVAATRAKDLLVLSGVPLGGAPGASPSGEIRKRVPGIAPDVQQVEYTSRTGERFVARVSLAPVVATGDDESDDASGDGAGEARALGDEPPIPLAAPPDGPADLPTRARHSATELLALERCPRKHWFRYSLGLPEPPRAGSRTEQGLTAIRRGLIVHDALEHVHGGRDVDEVLEEAIGRWDPDAPPPDSLSGRRYRDVARGDVSGALGDPAYREVIERRGARRELSFLRVLPDGGAIEGKVDLVAPGEEGYTVIDVKTGDCDADVAPVKAEQYAIQRAVYVDAIESITGGPVESFAFQFTGPATRVGGPLTAADRDALRAQLAEALSRSRDGEGEPPPLTHHTEECGFCGYRDVGWCPGAGKAAHHGSIAGEGAER